MEQNLNDMNIDDILEIPLAEVDKQVFDQMVTSISHHAPSEHSLQKIRDLRQGAIEMSLLVIKNTTSGRERALALTNLEQMVMWAVKAVVLEDARSTN